VLIFGSTSYQHAMIGGQWKRIVDARRLGEGVQLRLGVPMAGENDTIYLTVIAG
jgi:hypothetical protein